MPNIRETAMKRQILRHMSINIKTGIILLFILLVCSCSSLQAGLYLVFVDKNNGEYLLQNEENVKYFLQNVAELNDQYTVRTFVRTAIYHQIKRTKLVTHSYYVFISNNGEYYTLSFYGTKISFQSKGVWAFNADSDINSYKLFLNGNNKWDVTEIYQDKRIDVRQTTLNIIKTIDRGIYYYYRDHIRKKKNASNCNTALYDTIVFSSQ